MVDLFKNLVIVAALVLAGMAPPMAHDSAAATVHAAVHNDALVHNNGRGGSDHMTMTVALPDQVAIGAGHGEAGPPLDCCCIACVVACTGSGCTGTAATPQTVGSTGNSMSETPSPLARAPSKAVPSGHIPPPPRA